MDTLKLIATTSNVSVDYLLGYPIGQCQSCGMILTKDSDYGTESDGQKAEEYCASCYQQGQFAQELTIEEQIEHNLQDLDAWNKETGLHLSEQEARDELRKLLPQLKRWREEGDAEKKDN